MFIEMIKNKKTWIFAYIVIVCVTGAMVFFSSNGFVHLFKMKKELYELARKNDELKRENMRLLKNIQLFTSRRILQEESIRKELGWVKEGEIVIDFPAQRPSKAIHPESVVLDR